MIDYKPYNYDILIYFPRYKNGLCEYCHEYNNLWNNSIRVPIHYHDFERNVFF